MKNFFKYVLVIVVCLACTIAYNALLDPSIVSISKGTSNGVYDSYIIKYSNGKTDAITVKNGEDGQDISVEDLYNATKTAKGYGDDYTILDFIDEYMSFSVEEKDEANAYLGVLSTVEVYCEFPTSTDYMTGQKGYGLSMGAGVIYQPSGVTDTYYILTNFHVVYNSQSLSADNLATKYTCFIYGSNSNVSKTQLSNGGYTFSYSSDAINCTYVGGSMENDIAVLKVENSTLIENSIARPASICQDDAVVGETVVAIGNPQGLGTSVTKGIVSVDSEYLTMKASDNLTIISFRAVRIDASVNSGNSGGGLYNTKGQLLGIVNSKIQATGVEGMAFALPAVASTRIVDNIIQNGTKKAIKPILKLTTMVNSSKAVYNSETKNIKVVEEIKVSEIDATSICYNKLQVGDIIQSIQVGSVEYKIDRDFRLDELCWIMQKDAVVYFNVKRAENTLSVPIVIDGACFNTVS